MVVPDLPGFGASPPLSPGFRLPEVRDLILGLLDALELERVDLVGHSLGGALAIATTLAAPHRIRRLALVSPIAITRMRGRPNWIHPSLDWPARVLGPLAVRLADSPRMARMLISGAVRAPAEIEPRLRRELIVDSFRARRSTAAGFDSIRRRLPLRDLPDSLPVLAIWGERDTVTEAQRPVFEHALPAARSVVIRGSGHAPMLDRPVEVLELLQEFLGDERWGVRAPARPRGAPSPRPSGGRP